MIILYLDRIFFLTILLILVHVIYPGKMFFLSFEFYVVNSLTLLELVLSLCVYIFRISQPGLIRYGVWMMSRSPRSRNPKVTE